MLSIHARNVNEALWRAGILLRSPMARSQGSRNGPVVAVREPVCTTYSRPCERVLICPQRRANPFFHLFEAFWMLSGGDDARWLDRYVRDYSSRFAEEDGHQHGAYGYRWRRRWEFDQLDWAVQTLTEDPDSRRVCIAMWDPDCEVLTPHSGRDLPCNTHVYLRLHDGDPKTLDLTVLCRSNDAVWGAYGANAVHFSVLLEYLAWRLKVSPGAMYQFSNNLHVYESVVDRLPSQPFSDPYANGKMIAEPLFDDIANDEDLMSMLPGWMEDPSDLNGRSDGESPSLFRKLLIPMSRTHDLIKEGRLDVALSMTLDIWPSDWRVAAQAFIQERRR